MNRSRCALTIAGITEAMGRTDLNILLLVMVTDTSQQGLMVRDLVISKIKG